MDKEALFRRRLPEDDVTIDGVGTVRVRALNRGEVLLVQNLDSRAKAEQKMLAFGMVNPELTEADVVQWQQASPAGEIEPVSNKIAELSGILPGSVKEQYKSDGDESVG